MPVTLPTHDGYAYSAVVESVTGARPDVDSSLSVWRSSKSGIVSRLDGNLYATRHVEAEIDQSVAAKEAASVMANLTSKVCDMMSYLLWDGHVGNSDYYGVVGLCDPDMVVSPSIGRDVLLRSEGKKNLVLKSGTKPLKALRKALEYYEYGFKEELDRCVSNLSTVTAARKVSADVVFSVAPQDFLTMSDNECGWSSCTSLRKTGSYCFGPVSMMNSPYAVVAYIKSKGHPWMRYGDVNVSNKSWRALVYVFDGCIVVGRSYPYTSQTLSDAVADAAYDVFFGGKAGMRGNVVWPPELGPEYAPAHRWCLEHRDKPVVLPCFSGGMMYNDFESFDDHYPMRAVDRFKAFSVNVAGPQTCLVCGDLIDNAPSQSLTCLDCTDFQ